MKKGTNNLAAKVNAELREKELEKIEADSIAKVQMLLGQKPFATKLYLKIHLKLPDDFWGDHIICFTCHHVEKKSAYCIAQNAMRHEVTFTCKCGNKIICK